MDSGNTKKLPAGRHGKTGLRDRFFAYIIYSILGRDLLQILFIEKNENWKGFGINENKTERICARFFDQSGNEKVESLALIFFFKRKSIENREKKRMFRNGLWEGMIPEPKIKSGIWFQKRK